MALTDDTPRCSSRKTQWRTLVPDGVELPVVGPGLSKREIRARLRREGLPERHLKAYCLQPAGKGTDNVGDPVHCSLHLGNHQGAGARSPAALSLTYAERAKSLMGRETRELAEQLEADPDLMALRMDMVQLRRFQLDALEMVEAGEGITLDNYRAIRAKLSRAILQMEAHDLDGLERTLDEATRIMDDTTQVEMLKGRYLGLTDRLSKLAEKERKRLVELGAMISADRLEIIKAQLLAENAAAIETIIADPELQDRLKEELRRRMLTRGEQRRREMLGLPAPRPAEVHGG